MRAVCVSFVHAFCVFALAQLSVEPVSVYRSTVSEHMPADMLHRSTGARVSRPRRRTRYIQIYPSMRARAPQLGCIIVLVLAALHAQAPP